MKYFTKNIEYPQNPAGDILPEGELWEYISETFLNGFINYVNIKKAYLLNRNCTVSGIIRWGKFKGSIKSDIVKQAIEYDKVKTKHPNPFYHTKLRMFGDDVVILAKTKNGYEEGDFWYFFWFDCDVSDCQIGRFKTDDTEEQVIAEFDRHINENIFEYTKMYQSVEKHEPIELPSKIFDGWIQG